MAQQNIKIQMQKQSIVPEVISAYPPEVLEITYEDGVKVELGNIITPNDVKNKPTVKWNAEPETYYTLCMTDPDAPSREKPKFREWHHWLVVNILEDRVHLGETLSEYIGAGPPKGTGHHRYIFLLYKQKKKMAFAEKKLTNKSGKDRGKFSISKFAEKYKLGDPVAGNFFQAEYDDYVPILYKQLNCC